MNMTRKTRVDEVSQYYKPAAQIGFVIFLLFWVTALLSLCMPFSEKLGVHFQNILQSVFIVFVIAHFATSQINRFYLIPRAERMRRKQMISDAFGTNLSHDKTSLYYNNEYLPSVNRLGANTIENALFSKEVVASMLCSKRIITSGYVAIWVLAFALRHNNLEILTWITQIVFSGAIIAQWMNLEVLRFRHENTYEQLHSHFLHEISENSPRAVATILDAFVAYESAKSSAGCLLSSKVFNKLNPEITKKWDQIRQELNMNFQQDAALNGDSAGASSPTVS